MITAFNGDYFQWLRGFYFVAQTGSVSAAGRALNLSQPTVSHQIKSLEEHYGVTLFDRSGGGMALTSDGKVMLNHVISVFDSVKDISDYFAPTVENLNGKVIITGTHALLTYYLAPHVAGFRKKHPNVTFELIGGGLSIIRKTLQLNQADFGLAYIHPLMNEFEIDFLFNAGLVLIAPRENFWHLQLDISTSKIAKLPFIGYPTDSTMRSLINQQFGLGKYRINEIIDANHFESIKAYVKLGAGVSILFDYVITEQDKKDYCIIPLNHLFGKIPMGVIARKNKYLSREAKAFWAELNPTKSNKNDGASPWVDSRR